MQRTFYVSQLDDHMVPISYTNWIKGNSRFDLIPQDQKILYYDYKKEDRQMQGYDNNASLKNTMIKYEASIHNKNTRIRGWHCYPQ